MTRKEIEDYFSKSTNTVHEIHELLCSLDLDLQATQYIVHVIEDNYNKKCEWLSSMYDNLPE